MERSDFRLLSVRVSQADFAKLEHEASALGLKPAVLARVLLRTGLNAPSSTPGRHTLEEFRAAITRLDSVGAEHPARPVDAVELVRRTRETRQAQAAEARGRGDADPQ